MRRSAMLFLLAVCACGGAAPQLKQLNASLSALSKSEAVACAPLAYATAEAHLVFARDAYSQGVHGRAQLHERQAAINMKVLDALVLECRARIEARRLDSDGDGVPDYLDACAGGLPSQVGDDGCETGSDADGDGVLDLRDLCIALPEDRDGFADEDGCPDPDNDADGVSDDADKCPDVAEDPDGFDDADGCPEDDNDGDGVDDLSDDCPMEAGPNAGCPTVPLSATGTWQVLSASSEVVGYIELRETEVKVSAPLDFVGSHLTEASVPTLVTLAKILREKIDVGLRVSLRPRKGSKKYRTLAQKRLDWLTRALVARGIDGRRVVGNLRKKGPFGLSFRRFSPSVAEVEVLKSAP